ncbi:MAG: PDZ domain-containing protein [Actinomycetota bacterium]
MTTRKLAALIPLAAVLLASWVVRLPYYSEGPGPARDVEPLIRVSGHERFQSGGHLILTTVSFRTLNVYQAIGAWLDPVRSIVSQDVFIAPGETQQQADQRSLSEMDESKIDAAFVVLSRLTRYPKEHGAGVLVESVFPGCPASGRLFPGDRIDRVDGQRIGSIDDFNVLLHRLPVARRVRLHGEAGGEAFDVTVTRKRCAGSKRPLIGIAPVATFPFDITISSGDIGGPSAGLMWALGLYDLLTPGDLTGGRTVAGTGVIEPRGEVGPIGGVGDKIAAAAAAGADVFLVPKGNLQEAREAGGDLPLVPVGSFGQALAALRRGATAPGTG